MLKKIKIIKKIKNQKKKFACIIIKRGGYRRNNGESMSKRVVTENGPRKSSMG